MTRKLASSRENRCGLGVAGVLISGHRVGGQQQTQLTGCLGLFPRFLPIVCLVSQTSEKV